MYKRSILALALACLFILSGVSGALAEAYGVVTSKGLRLRAQPTTESEQLGAYRTGTAVELRGYVDGWYWVRVGDDTGYMSAQYVRPAKSGFVSNRGKYVNLRKAPSYGADVLMQVESGELLAVLGTSGSFLQVVVKGRTGFMDARYVQIEELPYEMDSEMYQWVVGSDAVVQQFGRTESRLEYSDGFVMNAQYPKTGCAALDTAVEAFVGKAEQEARELLAEVREVGDDEVTELTLTYDAYRVGERYATVLESGWLDASYMAHQEDLAFAATADLETGKLLGAEDIFSTEGLQTALKMLTDRLDSVYGAEPFSEADVGWLSKAALVQDGVAVVLERGEYMPYAVGTLRVILPYAELERAGALAEGLDVSGAQSAGSALGAYDVSDAPKGGAAGEAQETTAAPGARVIDPNRPMIALTFDDGPSEATPRILAALDAVGGRATFCVIGNRVQNYEDVVRQVAAQGSEIACHTWNHKQLTGLSQGGIEREITRTLEAVARVTDAPVCVLRPPYGSVNRDVRAVTRSMNMLIASWSVDTLDWRTRNAEKTYRAIMKGAKNGAVILCHDLYDTTAAALERAIPELDAMGYQLVTFSELLSFHKEGARAGTVYSHLAPENIER